MPLILTMGELRDVRQTENVTLTKLAKETGIDREHIRQVELCNEVPSIEFQTTMVKYFECNIEFSRSYFINTCHAIHDFLEYGYYTNDGRLEGIKALKKIINDFEENIKNDKPLIDQ